MPDSAHHFRHGRGNGGGRTAQSRWRHQIIASGLVDMARRPSVEVAAQGVKRIEDAPLLKGIGVDLQQGYLSGAVAPSVVCRHQIGGQWK